MEEEIIQKFKDLILDEHYCEDCNELCGIGEAFPLEFVAKYIIKLEKENKFWKILIVRIITGQGVFHLCSCYCT